MKKRRQVSSSVSAISKQKKKLKKEHLQLISMTIPGMVLLLLFNYLPMFGVILSFKKFKYNLGVWKSPWCGFDNFEFFFKSGSLMRLLKNTVGMNLLFLLTGTLLNIVLALLLYEITNQFAIKSFQTILFLPFVISWVAASYALYANLSDVDGIINGLLLASGKEKIMWYGSAEKWPIILLICYIWKSIGFGVIVNYGNLIAIDKSYFEAAKLDGASRLQIMRYISLPFIGPIVITMFILSLGRVFNADFGMFYYMPRNSSLLYSTTDVIDTYVFRTLRVTGDVGMSSAVGLSQSIIGFFVLLLANKLAKHFSDEGGLI
ncbi:MAG: sugar ABC transporter permease [Lachnospiraceae bacterium]|nr:sugar ABC transporter permease [Lachnospiraceae bacterium]